MTRGPAWVVGAGGLLGSAVVGALGAAPFKPSSALRWGDPSLHASVSAAVSEFARAAQNARDSHPWELYWCAGAGVVGSRAADLARETAALRQLLESVRDSPVLAKTRGSILLASSAGGVHAGARVQPATEASEPAPLSDYGRTKVEQERLLREITREMPLVSTLAARYSNLYGVGQRLDKPQGLISQLARCAVFGAPAHVFVPLDTIRDYLYADDAGAMTVDALNRLALLPPGAQLTKLVASERESTIAALLGIFRSMTKRQLRVVLGVRAMTALQPRKLTFRSGLWREQRGLVRTELVDGIARVYRHQLRVFQLGRLARPA